MNLFEFKNILLPDNPGVYFFKKGKTILYIGKATSLKERVKSYFSNDLIKTRGPAIVDMVTMSNNILFEETDSVLEALLLESSLIKKYQPKYNVKERDNKSYNVVVITDEKYPRLLIVRDREIKSGAIDFKIKKQFGPFPNGGQLKEALRLIQKIFPFFDTKKPIDKLTNFDKKRFHLNVQLGIYPDIFSGSVTLSEYKKIIKNISLFFEGKKKQILNSLEKEMRNLAKEHHYEKAAKIIKTIFALKHINDVSILNKETALIHENMFNNSESVFRIESYDVAHTFGVETVGVMVVSENLSINKSELRKFILRNSRKHDDYGALLEILERRFHHSEWRKPNLIVIDGGHGQRNVAVKLINKIGKKLKIDIVSVVKNDQHKARELLGPKEIIEKYRDHIIAINAETHRAAITFHRKRRDVIK